jgi:hypothetical protein
LPISRASRSVIAVLRFDSARYAALKFIDRGAVVGTSHLRVAGIDEDVADAIEARRVALNDSCEKGGTRLLNRRAQSSGVIGSGMGLAVPALPDDGPQAAVRPGRRIARATAIATPKVGFGSWRAPSFPSRYAAAGGG